MSIKLLPHQTAVLEQTANHNRVAYYLDMGLGKTFVGSEKLQRLGAGINMLVCQKSKIDDWAEHFAKFYPFTIIVYNKPEQIPPNSIIIINYDLVWRRPELKKLRGFTLMLDESSYIKIETSKRSKFILGLKPDNVILLSGTPTGGKYEEIWSQCSLLGWNISKKLFWRQYVETETIEDEAGFPRKIVVGYKNVDRLKAKLREHGAVFMKTEEVLTLPDKVETVLNIRNTKAYRKFKRDRIIEVEDVTLVGDHALTRMLYLRQLAGMYNEGKYERLRELLESTNDRVIVFYEFQLECDRISEICQGLEKPVAIVNGSIKNLEPYEQDGSVTLIQYQAGALGLNLQKANTIVYFTLTRSSELFEQSKKRIHRIGQSRTCFYYYLLTKGSIDWDVYETLKIRKDFTDELFREEYDR